MNEQDVAWAAGVFEGEGSLYLRNVSSGKYATAEVKMTDEDIVRRFAAIVGVGNVYFKPERRLNWKNCWAWTVNGKAGVSKVGEMFRPWLGVRRLDTLERIMLECS